MARRDSGTGNGYITDSDPTTSNIFVRFRQHVDSCVASALDGLLGFQIPYSPRLAVDGAAAASPFPFMDSPREAPALGDVASSLASPSYSPLALRHLPPPTPKDLPPGLDPYIFTFEDAFEDLLAVSRGQPLPDIAVRFGQRKMLRQMFPTGEPYWFWVRRLESQGLLRRCSSFGFPSIGLQPDWASFHRELEAKTAQVWRAVASEVDGFYREQLDQPLLDGAFRSQDGLSRTWPSSRNDEPVEVKAQSLEQPKRPAPETFDDLFSSFSSTLLTNSSRSWDSFVRILTGSAPFADSDDSPLATSSISGSNSATRQTETRDDYVDRYGYLHSTVTRKILDADGREIGHESYTTMCPADQASPDSHGNSQVNGDRPAQKQSGWFWK